MSIKQTFKSIHDSGKVPEGWRATTIRKVKIRNRMLIAQLRNVKAGKWQKVYAIGTDGVEIHYFQHKSGEVFNVKIKRIY